MRGWPDFDTYVAYIVIGLLMLAVWLLFKGC